MRRKKQKTGKIFFSILVIVALVVGGFFAYEYLLKEDNNLNNNAEEPAQEEPQINTIKANDEAKPIDEKQKTEDGKEKIVKYEGSDPNNSEQLTGAITYAGKTDTNLLIRLNIDQYLNTGTCKLNLIKDDIVEYSDTANLIADVSTSTCEGFNVQLSKLKKGHYIINIVVVSNNKNGTINGEIDV